MKTRLFFLVVYFLLTIHALPCTVFQNQSLSDAIAQVNCTDYYVEPGNISYTIDRALVVGASRSLTFQSLDAERPVVIDLQFTVRFLIGQDTVVAVSNFIFLNGHA